MRKAGVKRKEEPEDTKGPRELTERLILVFLLKFMGVSIALLVLWYYLGIYYQSVVFQFARYILLFMGYTSLQISAVNLSGAYLGNFNLVPFVALAITTPKFSPVLRLKLLAVGLPLLFILHVIDLVAHYPLYFYGSEFAQVIVYSIGVAGVALPFIIWFFIWYSAFIKR